MRVHSLTLKNFKGIKLGSLHRAEIQMDFGALPDGLIAIKGSNGAGKTTILDNLHPYRTMPFRDSQSLYEAVDGAGEKTIVFEMPDGSVYNSRLEINSKSRTMDAHLDRFDNGKWVTVVDGRAEDYDAEIEKIVMPEKLFFIAEFRAQNAKSFKDYKKGDLKELFEKLIGLEHFLDKSLAAKARRQETEGRLSLKNSEIEMTRRSVEGLQAVPPLPDEIAGKEQLKRAAEGKIAATEKEIAGLAAKISVLTEKSSSMEKQIIERSARSQETLRDFSQRIEALDKKIDGYEAISRQSSMIAEASSNLAGIRKEIQGVHDAIKARTVLLEEKQGLIKTLSSREKEQASRSAELKALKEKLSELLKAAKLLDEVPCDSTQKESCKLLSNALESYHEIPAIKTKVESLGSSLDESARHIKDVTGEIEKRSSMIDGLPMAVPKELLSKESELQGLAAQAPVLDMALKEMGALKEERKDLKERYALEEKTFDEENARRGKEWFEVKTALSALPGVSTLEGKRDSLKQEAAAISQEIEALRVMELRAAEEKRRKEEAETRASALEQEAAAIKKDVDQWHLIEKGFGRDGLIALELELASPEVSNLVNSLLEEMGGRFAVRFETLRPKANKKNEYIETFDVKVLDAETGIEKSLVDLSGGERVWIDDAIARAVGIYLSRKSGSRVQTLISDERDGALDKTKKLEYCAMKRQVLKLGGYVQEFFVSHAPDLWDLADATITIDQAGVHMDIRSARSAPSAKGMPMEVLEVFAKPDGNGKTKLNGKIDLTESVDFENSLKDAKSNEALGVRQPAKKKRAAKPKKAAGKTAPSGSQAAEADTNGAADDEDQEASMSLMAPSPGLF